MKANLHPLACALALIALASPVRTQDTTGPKVEEQVVGPAKQGLVYAVSPRGAHLATVTQKGSRFVVVVDGVEGPKFDDIVACGSGAKVVFSPDGTRHAYVARSGQEFVVVVDGKELSRPGNATDSYGSSPVLELAFTSNSKHVWFLQQVHKSNQPEDNYVCVVVDGVPEIPGGTAPVFSPDGDHWAYVASNPKDPSRQTVVRDGKPAGYAGTDPKFTGDSQHLLVRTAVPLGPNRGQALQVLLDGQPWLKAEDATLFVAPAGDLVAAAVVRATDRGRASVLVIGGKKVEGSESANIPRVTFSPDGKRYAAECETSANTRFVLVDGKKGQEYPMIANLAFSPDSRRCAYQATIGGKTFVVVDDEESDGYFAVQEFAFGGGGKRTGYLAQPEFPDRIVVVDGAATAVKSQNAAGLAFSSDGSRCAYVVIANDGEHLVLDGVEATDLNLMPFRSTFAYQPPRFVFSPDGKHLAVFAAPAGKTEAAARGLFLDGKRVQAGLAFLNPTFTPDGNHLVWMAPDETPNRYGIFVDGRKCAQMDAVGLLPPAARTWEMGDDGVLTVLAQDGEKWKRIRVTPAAGTSLETLLASAK